MTESKLYRFLAGMLTVATVIHLLRGDMVLALFCAILVLWNLTQ